jgi:hypothetical protein
MTFEDIARRAVACNLCFSNCDVAHATIDIAQPRWVGPGYWNAHRKVVLIMINPGAGVDDDRHRRECALIHSYHDGQATLDEVFKAQRDEFARWGRSKFLPFIENSLTLRVDDIALMNIAWCATRGNKYPDKMLDQCFQLYTAPALVALQPDVLTLCGGKAHRFADRIRAWFPNAKVFCTLHYAHREGAEAERSNTAPFRQFIAST